MTINNKGTRMVKDGEDWHGLPTTKFKKIRLNFLNRSTVTQPSFLYSDLFRRISFQYLLSSHLTLIAGIHCTIWVTLIADFTLPQVAVVSDFGVAGMTAACETTVRVCTCVLAWAVQTLVHICYKKTSSVKIYGCRWRDGKIMHCK